MNYNNETEKYIFDTVKYIEELIAEFGILHPLVEKTMKEFLDHLQPTVNDGHHFSENLATGLTRHLERWMARRENAIEEQQLLAEKKSNASWLGALISGVVVLGIAAFLYQCFRKKDPTQVLHHHSGSVTDNININHSGYVTENINLRLSKF